MDAILKSHSIMADAKVLSDGPAESDYSHQVRCVISQSPWLTSLGARYRCYIHLSWGWYGGEYYNEDRAYMACGRGDSISEAIRMCRADVASDDNLTYETKQALSVAYDEAEENEASEMEITYGD